MQDQMIKAYVNEVFGKYDTDNSGTLDEDELTYFFNDLFKTLGINTKVTKEQSLEAIRSIDKNSDGSVDREELFLAFKSMLENVPKESISQSYPPPAGYSQTEEYNRYKSSNLSTSYPPPMNPPAVNPPRMNPPPQYPPPGYHGYQQSAYNEYGIENPYMKQAQYYPQQQYQQPYQNYQPPYQQPPYQPTYQPPYQPGYQHPPYYGSPNPYIANNNLYMPANQDSRWGSKR